MERWAPYYMFPPVPMFTPTGLGIYGGPTEPCNNIGKTKKTARGVIPRAVQNRMSAQRVRDHQKSHIKFLEDRVVALEASNAAIAKEIEEIKTLFAHKLEAAASVKQEVTSPLSIIFPDSPVSLLSTTSSDDTEESIDDTDSSSVSQTNSFSFSNDDFDSFLSDEDLSFLPLLTDSVLPLPMEISIDTSLPINNMEMNVAIDSNNIDMNVPMETGIDMNTVTNNNLNSLASFYGQNGNGLSCESAVLALPQQQESLFSYLMFCLMMMGFSKSTWNYFLMMTGLGLKKPSELLKMYQHEAVARSTLCDPLEGQMSREWALALVAFKVS